MRGICEDYRAAISIDLAHDRASRELGEKIRCPLLAVWGKSGKIEKSFDALAIWRQYCSNDVTGGAIESGHYIAEENPTDLLAWFNRFF